MAFRAGKDTKPARQCEFTQNHKEMGGEAVLAALQLVAGHQLSSIQKYHLGIHLTFRNWPKLTATFLESHLYARSDFLKSSISAHICTSLCFCFCQGNALLAWAQGSERRWC